jgi:hypothetical protein
MKVSKFWFRKFYTPFDGSGDPPPVEKTFKQEDVDRIVQERLKKERAEVTKLTKEIQDFQSRQKLSEDEKAELASKLEELENRGKTSEELAKQTEKKLRDKYEADLKTAREGESNWKNLFESSTIERKISDAAELNKAVRSALLVDLLKGKTRLVNEDGKFVSRTKIQAIGENSATIELDLPTEEAVAKMKEYPDLYGSLFQSSASGGVNGNNTGTSGGGGTPNPNNIKSMDDYMKNRQKLKTR